MPDPNKRVIDSRSLYLGRYDNPAFPDARSPLSYEGERHLLTFGPNGSGKGTRLLVPNLLTTAGRSVVVIDPKGELCAITGAYRSTISDVVVLNPFGTLGIPGGGYNPLAALDPDSELFLDDARGLGDALIKIEGKDPHWSQSAQSLVVALIMWEVREAKRQKRMPTLKNVRFLLTEADRYQMGADGRKRQVAGLRVTAQRIVREGNFQMASLAGRFLRGNDEISSIQSTADSQTFWMLSGPMSANLARNDIDFKILKKRPTTVYVILPPEYMETHSVWLRLLIVSALRALYSPGGLRTLFILDEFAQLGHLKPVENALALIRGYGIQLWPILQDLTQLKALYKERWETFIANAGVVQGFAPNDLTTAKWMSERAGETTAVAAGYNLGDSQSEQRHSASSGMSWQQVKRPLFTPTELMGIRAGSGLLFPVGSSKCIPNYAPSYWKVPSLAARASPNPYFPGK